MIDFCLKSSMIAALLAAGLPWRPCCGSCRPTRQQVAQAHCPHCVPARSSQSPQRRHSTDCKCAMCGDQSAITEQAVTAPDSRSDNDLTRPAAVIASVNAWLANVQNGPRLGESPPAFCAAPHFLCIRLERWLL